MQPSEIRALEQRLQSVLAKMFSQGDFNKICDAINEAFSKFTPGKGSYQLLFKSQVQGFGADSLQPAAVNLLAEISTGTKRVPGKAPETIIAYGTINLKSPKPCAYCRGSGIELSSFSKD